MKNNYDIQFQKLFESFIASDNFSKFIEAGKVILKNIDKLSSFEEKMKLFYLLGISSSKLGYEADAVGFCNRGIRLIDDEVVRSGLGDNYNKKELCFQKGLSLSRLAETDEELFVEAEKAFDEYVRLSISDAARGLVLGGDFYSFRKINEYTLADLSKNQITVTNPALFNDPFDCLFYHFIKTNKDSSFDNKALIKSFEKIRIRSFVSDRLFNRNTFEFENRRINPLCDVLMWSHYADSHNGICVLYNFEYGFREPSQKVKGYFFKEEYFKDEIVDLTKETKIEFEYGFLTKNKCWGYEGEVRLLYFDPKCNDDFIHLPLYDAKVCAIYFGLNCAKDYVDRVKNIFENTGVRFYKMKTDPTDIYNLIVEECLE